MAKRKRTSVPQEETQEELVHTDSTEAVDEPTVDETEEETPTEEVAAETPTENVEETSELNDSEESDENEISEPEAHTVEIVYLGISEKATVRGKVTGQKYSFYKDEYGMPKASMVDERDSSGILSLKGKACCGKDPNRLFETKQEWDLEIQQAKKLNR